MGIASGKAGQKGVDATNRRHSKIPSQRRTRGERGRPGRTPATGGCGSRMEAPTRQRGQAGGTDPWSSLPHLPCQNPARSSLSNPPPSGLRCPRGPETGYLGRMKSCWLTPPSLWEGGGTRPNPGCQKIETAKIPTRLPIMEKRISPKPPEFSGGHMISAILDNFRTSQNKKSAIIQVAGGNIYIYITVGRGSKVGKKNCWPAGLADALVPLSTTLLFRATISLSKSLVGARGGTRKVSGVISLCRDTTPW